MSQLFPYLAALLTRRAPAVGGQPYTAALPLAHRGPLGGRSGHGVATADGMPMRRLPWNDGEGRACYVVGWGTGRISRMADAIEGAQLDRAADLLDEAYDLFAEDDAPQAEVRRLAERLTRSLHEAHRVAESRGQVLRALAGGTGAGAEDGERSNG